ncbi:MAG TPA: aminotransferase class I/II-fold pyridoxal phosphate-dependent enzyme [Gemmatimonadaceae bacterium]|nr:aminotransferase class I/II-fold pyridoxal phosphate-dependent enzyme [Gemmatimonadaceae bacterium]
MPPTQSDTLRNLPPYVFAELDRLKADARARGATLVDLGIGSPNLAVAPGIVRAMAAAGEEPTSGAYPPFRATQGYFDAIADFMHARFGATIEPEVEALALSGAKEGIAQLIFALCNPGDVVLVPEIFYPVFARAPLLCGAEVRWVPMRAENDFVLDLDAISAADRKRAKVLIANYPNNPTGARVEIDFHERAVEFCRQNDLLYVSDMAYSELTFGGRPAPSALEADPDREVTIEFHSCSKTFSMAGMRIGFAVGNRDAIEALAAYRTNVGYGTPTVMQAAATYALNHYAELVPATVAEYRARRDAMMNAFHAAGWNAAPPPASMYLWLPIPEGTDDWEWVRTLIDEDGVVVTPGMAFGEGGKGYFRVSLVRDRDTLAKAATTIGARREAMLTRA